MRRTYYFHVKKCIDPTCTFHTTLDSGNEIEPFPDPIPYTDDDGVERYKEGFDEEEKYLTSRLVDVTKQPHGLSYSPTAQTAKNTSRNVKCAECKKPRVIYSAKMLKPDERSKLRNFLKNNIYIYGTSFSAIQENPVAYARENLSCSVPIETAYYGMH